MAKPEKNSMPAPTMARYAQQARGMMPTLLSPVGGFDTTSGAIASFDHAMELKSLKAANERSNIDRMSSLNEQASTAMVKAQGDTLQFQKDKFNEDNKLGVLGTMGMVDQTLGTAYDTARSLEDSPVVGKFFGQVGKGLGNLRPTQEKAYQMQKQNQESQAEMDKINERIMARLADANNGYNQEEIDGLNEMQGFMDWMQGYIQINGMVNNGTLGVTIAKAVANSTRGWR